MNETALTLIRPAGFERNLLDAELERRAQERAEQNWNREQFRRRAVTHMRRLRGWPQFGIGQVLGFRRSADNQPVLELSHEEFAALGTTPTRYDHQLATEQAKLAHRLIAELENLWLQVFVLTNAATTQLPEPPAAELADAAAEWRNEENERTAAFDRHLPRNDGQQWQPRRWPPREHGNFLDLHRFILEERVHLATALRARHLDTPDTMDLLGTAENQ